MKIGSLTNNCAIAIAILGTSLAAYQAIGDAGPVFEGQWGCTVPNAPGCGGDITFECGAGATCCYVAWYSASSCLIDWHPACCVAPENGCHGRIRDGVIYNWCGGPDDDPQEDPKTDPGVIG